MAPPRTVVAVKLLGTVHVMSSPVCQGNQHVIVTLSGIKACNPHICSPCVDIQAALRAPQNRI